MIDEVPFCILAGGQGTRLRSVLPGIPKGLAAIGDRPFLEIQIEYLRDQGARRFVLLVGHLAEQIEDYFQDGRRWGVSIDYSRDPGMPLGTGGAVRHALNHIDERAFVMNGDTFFAVDYAELLQDHLRRVQADRCCLSIALAKSPDAARFGSVDVEESTGRIRGFREKNPDRPAVSGWLNAGTYIIESSVVRQIEAGQAVSIEREVFPHLIAKGDVVSGLCRTEAFYDIGTPEDWKRFSDTYLSWFKKPA